MSPQYFEREQWVGHTSSRPLMSSPRDLVSNHWRGNKIYRSPNLYSIGKTSFTRSKIQRV